VIVLESKLKGKANQYVLIDEAIRTAQFCRNKALRFWLDNHKIKGYDLNKYMAVLAKEFEFVSKLNSQARQASAERAWLAISRFFHNCQKKIPGKKGFPKFKKNSRSVEYKTTGWKLSEDRKSITFSDGFEIGRLKLIGTRDLNFYSVKQIKRVRIVKRADGYYVQFCIDVNRAESLQATGKAIGIDVGLTHFYTDNQGQIVENPRYLRKSEKALKRLQKRVSRKNKGSNNYRKAINRLGRKHLQVSRQRKDFAVKTARCVVMSNDFVAYEDLQVRNLMKNHKLAKSISDVGWSQFFAWLQYFGLVFGKIVVAVPPQYTSQNCSQCGETVKKSLRTRTHVCKCGCVLDRDHNAGINILAKGFNTVGHTGINALGQINLCAVDVSSQHKLTG